jgi:hypothetical protein
MIDIYSKRCIEKDCEKYASYNYENEKVRLYCSKHSKDGMIDISIKITKCLEKGCKKTPIYGLHRPTHCEEHKKKNQKHIEKEKLCSIENCNNNYIIINDGNKLCFDHTPSDLQNNIEKFCKYCAIKDDSIYVCKECEKNRNKKESQTVQYLRKVIDTPFDIDTNYNVSECSNRRPDIHFQFNTYDVIVEIDEDQHRSYEEMCECARLNEIVNSIGGKSVIFIRYNPDTILNKNKKIIIDTQTRLDKLVEVIKEQLSNNYDKFLVKLIQLFYNDNEEIYQEYKEENITDVISV